MSGPGVQLAGSHPTMDTLLRVARIMDCLGLERGAQAQAAAALSLYLMTLQVDCSTRSCSCFSMIIWHVAAPSTLNRTAPGCSLYRS